MPFFSFKADILKIDSKRSAKIINEFLLKEYRVAAAAFVREAIKHIPVDTGMAAGSFLHIGRLLRVAINITPKKTREVTIRGRNYTINYGKRFPYYYHSPAYRKPKTPELGSQLTSVNGTPSDQLGDDPNSLFKQIGASIEFKLSAKTFHLTLNDLVGSSGTGPWGAFAKGEEVMMARLRTMNKRFPSIDKFLLRSRISVGRGGAVSSNNFEPLVNRTTIEGE